jgi:hypothetical protein
MFSFAPDASPDFQESISKLTQAIAQNMDRNLALNALGSDAEKPFSATRDGDVVHLVYPLHVKEGDLLGGLITILAAQIPTCIIHQGNAGWSEPEWTAESRAHLSGLISGLQKQPESFAHTSSPADLARISLWLTACSAALSRPGGVADAHGDVLPSSVGGGRSASKYMTRIMSALRSNVTDESVTRSVDTLGLLLKVWQKHNYERALQIVRKCKLGWSTVLFRGAPTTIIKGKRGKPDQTVVRSPPKPSRSPWLSSAERSELGNLYKDDWSALDKIRDNWVALPAEEQHKQFNSFVKRIKQHYEKLNNLSNTVHARLGKRKHWIELVCKEDKYKPKVKRDESESFLLAAHFFSKNLKQFDKRVARVFAPVTYLPDPDGKLLGTWNELLTMNDDQYPLTSDNFSLEDEGAVFKLWQIWADLFQPTFGKKESQVEEAPPTEDRNIFTKLLGLAQS